MWIESHVKKLSDFVVACCNLSTQCSATWEDDLAGQDESPDLVMKAQGRVEVLSIAQHLLERLPAGVVITRSHKKLLYLLKLVYSAQEHRMTLFSLIYKATPHFVL